MSRPVTTATRPAAQQPRTAAEVEQFEADAAVNVLRAMLIESKRHHRR